MASSTSTVSSIPSTSKFKAFRRMGWGLLVVLLILAIADIYIFRNAYTYDLGTEKGARGGIIGQWAQLDRSFEGTDPDRIEYAILGDSQSLDAFRPDMMADELGMEDEQVFNFSVTGGKPTDIAYTYRQYIERLPNLQHIILVVNEHQFNNADSAKDPKFKFHATLRQRIQAMDRDNYGELLTGWVFRSFGMRTEWQSLVGRYRSGELPVNPAAFPGGIQPMTWSAPADRTADFAMQVADRWFKDWQMDGVYTHTFDQLVSDIHDDGIELTIVQLPRTDLFEQQVRSKYAAEQQAYFDHIRSIASASSVEFTVMDAITTGVTIDSFRDTNHVNPHGAEQLSRYAADRWWR
ncbi:MAG: hypothetical protein WDZ91_00695 [Paenibacillaceae bacterium]